MRFAAAVLSLLLSWQLTASELDGLWKATKRFGPEGRGPLLITRSGNRYTADFLGRTVQSGELSFELPEGAFRGHLQGGEIRGHWLSLHNVSTGPLLASPVRLKAAGPNRWAGEVVPLEDVFTFYLLLRKQADGSFEALLRNPQRDVGSQLGIKRLERVGDNVKLIGREEVKGFYNAQNDVLTFDFPSRGGTYDFHRDEEGRGFYVRGRTPPRYSYRPPPARDDGWPTATLGEVAIDQPAIERFIQKLIDMPMDVPDALQVHGVLIARHGKLVLEEYFHGQHRDLLHDTRSASKSVSATIIGAAMHAGVPLGLSSPVYQVMNGGAFPPDLEPRKKAMTLENLLTMSSGFFCDDTNEQAPGNEDAMLDQETEPDYYRYTLRVPMALPPGQQAIYCSVNPNLALGMLGRAAGQSPLYLFDRLVAAPLQIERYSWLLDPARNPYGGGSAQFLPRDFLKFGQLMLNGGTWKGRRILDRGFVERASSPLYRMRHLGYGYLWWTIDYTYKDRVVRAFFAGGAGGQGVMVVPELDLVIAMFGGNYSSPGSMEIQQNLPPRHILPAVREPGDDPHAPVEERAFTTPYGK